MLDRVRQDTRRLCALKRRSLPWSFFESLLFENGYQAVLLYRAASWFKRRRVPLLPPLVSRLGLLVTGVDIAPGADIGPGLIIAHGSGLVIGDRVRIGPDAILLHQVTIGAPDRERVDQMPEIGRNVYIGAGARVIGGICLGDDVVVGANTVLTQDVPSGARVVSTAEVRILPARDRPAAG